MGMIRKTGSDPLSFIEVDYPEPHRARAREIAKNHPEVKKLMGRNPYTALIILGVVALQITLAWSLRQSPFWAVLLTAFCVGAYANHALYVLIHDASHHLIFKNKTYNQFIAMMANLPLFFPSSASFFVYHLKHHQYQGDYELDADLAGSFEAKLIGNGFFGKALWELFFPVFQSLRVVRFSRSKRITAAQPWVLFNWLVQLGFDAFLFFYFGPMALAYMGLSLFFSIGFHPLGARWIQEHFVVHDKQETYSYYGPLNKLALNVGYHNEHHDFPYIAWNNLPKLKKLAPEMYDTLHSHKSWTKLWLKFLFDKNMSLYSRVTRDGEINKLRGRRSKITYAATTLDEDFEGNAAA